MNVAIIGASNDPTRFAYQAAVKLIEHGHTVFPVSLTGESILNQDGYCSIAEIEQPIDTITLYLSPPRFVDLVAEVITTTPKRVIFNPGTESEEIMKRFADADIKVVEDCTLVMLDCGRF